MAGVFKFVKSTTKFTLTFIAGAWTGVWGYMAVEDVIPQRYKKRIQLDLENRTVDDELQKRASEIFRFGQPLMGPELCYYKNHVLSYNQERKIPRWVMEHLTKEHAEGDASRTLVRFTSDPRIPQIFSSQNSDYKDSGWARGRLTPAGDHKFSQEAMEQTFLLSNAVPQDVDNNSGYWNRLEIFCRSLVDKYENVYIITGPLFKAKEESNSEKKFIRHYVIGRNEVHVPTHLFKILVADNDDGSNQVMGAFVIPNEPIYGDPPLKKFDVGLEYIERHAGLTLLPGLDREHVRDLCHVEDCQLINIEEFENHMAERRIEAASTVKKLNDVWSDLRRKKVRPSEDLKKAFLTKRRELEERQTIIQSGSE